MKTQNLTFEERKSIAKESDYCAQYFPWYSDGRVSPQNLTEEDEHILDMVYIPKSIFHFDFKRNKDGKYLIF